MVSLGTSWLGLPLLFAQAFLAQAPARPLIQRLDPERNVALMMALLGLVLVGIGLVACIMIGGHWVRRLARSRPPHKPSPPSNSEAWRASLAETLSLETQPDCKTGETIISDAPTDDTRAD